VSRHWRGIPVYIVCPSYYSFATNCIVHNMVGKRAESMGQKLGSWEDGKTGGQDAWGRGTRDKFGMRSSELGRRVQTGRK